MKIISTPTILSLSKIFTILSDEIFMFEDIHVQLIHADFKDNASDFSGS